MRANIVLADVGTQDPAGKLNLLGAGWAQISIGPTGQTSDFAVAVFLEVPWDKCNKELDLVLELRNEDGEAVTIPTAQPNPVRISQPHR